MKEKSINQAARQLAKKRWANATAEEIKAHNTRIAKIPRTAKRCFCGESSMWRAANRYFDCCRRAGVITLNLRAKEEKLAERRSGTGD